MEMIDFFNKHAEHWDDDYKEHDPIRAAVAALCGAKENSKVLDIACGTGVMFSELLRLNVGQLVGIDIADKMVEKARSKFVDAPNLRVECGNILEFNEEGFDVALMYNAYPHFLDKEAMIEHVSKRLLPNGRFTVVHGAGRQIINNCHGNVPSDISVKLMAAKEEAKRFEPWFNVDVIFDTPYFYMISGTVKE